MVRLGPIVGPALVINGVNVLRTVTLRTLTDLCVLHRLWMPDEITMGDYGTHQGLTLHLPAGKRKGVEDWAHVLGMPRPLDTHQSYSSHKDQFPDFAWLHWHTLHVTCPRVSIDTGELPILPSVEL